MESRENRAAGAAARHRNGTRRGARGADAELTGGRGALSPSDPSHGARQRVRGHEVHSLRRKSAESRKRQRAAGARRRGDMCSGWWGRAPLLARRDRVREPEAGLQPLWAGSLATLVTHDATLAPAGTDTSLLVRLHTGSYMAAAAAVAAGIGRGMALACGAQKQASTGRRPGGARTIVGSPQEEKRITGSRGRRAEAGSGRPQLDRSRPPSRNPETEEGLREVQAAGGPRPPPCRARRISVYRCGRGGVRAAGGRRVHGCGRGH